MSDEATTPGDEGLFDWIGDELAYLWTGQEGAEWPPDFDRSPRLPLSGKPDAVHVLAEYVLPVMARMHSAYLEAFETIEDDIASLHHAVGNVATQGAVLGAATDLIGAGEQMAGAILSGVPIDDVKPLAESYFARVQVHRSAITRAAAVLAGLAPGEPRQPLEEALDSRSPGDKGEGASENQAPASAPESASQTGRLPLKAASAG